MSTFRFATRECIWYQLFHLTLLPAFTQTKQPTKKAKLGSAHVRNGSLLLGNDDLRDQAGCNSPAARLTVKQVLALATQRTEKETGTYDRIIDVNQHPRLVPSVHSWDGDERARRTVASAADVDLRAADVELGAAVVGCALSGEVQFK